MSEGLSDLSSSVVPPANSCAISSAAHSASIVSLAPADVQRPAASVFQISNTGSGTPSFIKGAFAALPSTGLKRMASVKNGRRSAVSAKNAFTAATNVG